jgi:hypothetical protein
MKYKPTPNLKQKCQPKIALSVAMNAKNNFLVATLSTDLALLAAENLNAQCAARMWP